MLGQIWPAADNAETSACIKIMQAGTLGDLRALASAARMFFVATGKALHDKDPGAFTVTTIRGMVTTLDGYMRIYASSNRPNNTPVATIPVSIRQSICNIIHLAGPIAKKTTLYMESRGFYDALQKTGQKLLDKYSGVPVLPPVPGPPEPPITPPPIVASKPARAIEPELHAAVPALGIIAGTVGLALFAHTYLTTQN
jgi:hypothetical protein